MKFFAAALFCLGLASCAAAPESPAQQAENAACRSAADAQYRQDTIDQSARTEQNGLRYGAMPTQVFGAETLGALSQRDTEVQNCEADGSDNGQPEQPGGPYVTPHIIPN